MGYYKTKCLMLFKDYNSLKENNLLNIDKTYYLKNSNFIEENVKNVKILYLRFYLLYCF